MAKPLISEVLATANKLGSKDKNLKYKYITKTLIKAAFPTLIKK